MNCAKPFHYRDGPQKGLKVVFFWYCGVLVVCFAIVIIIIIM